MKPWGWSSLQSFEPTGELRLETIILDCSHLSSTIGLCSLGVHPSGFLAYLCILETALEMVTALPVLRLVQSLPSGVFVSSFLVSSIQQYSSVSSTLRMPVTVPTATMSFVTDALVDLESAGNFIYQCLSKRF